MEVTRYLCEFFFTDFWHWLGLAVIITLITPSFKITRTIKKFDKNDDKDKEEE